MSWRIFWLKLLALPISLWVMASIIFLLSRLLPQTQIPKGMEEADSKLMGATSQKVRARVMTEYQHRMGLDLPLFYFNLTTKSEEEARQFSGNIAEADLLAKLLKWHDKKLVLKFRSEFNKWNERPNHKASPSAVQLKKLLLAYSETKPYKERKILADQFSGVLVKEGQKRNAPSTQTLLRSWGKMVNSTPALASLYPAIVWHGSNNQYHLWLKKVLTGDFGLSSRDYRPVGEGISEALKTTFQIAWLGLGAAIIFATFLGIWLILNQHTWLEIWTRQILYVLDSIPGFLLTLSILAIFLWTGGSLSSANLYSTASDQFFSFQASSSYLLASLCVLLFLLPHLTLQFYQNVLQETGQDYFKTGLSKGLSFRAAILHHALPNALPSLLTLLSEIIIGLMAGVLIVEITFSLPGLGSLLAQSVLTRDYNMLIAITLLLLTFRVLVNWATDLAYLISDPRMRTA